MSNERKNYYPVSLDMKGKGCIVVGGGEVARRKVEVLLNHGAQVSVISPVVCPELVELEKQKGIRLVKREYKAGDLEGAFIAIAATDNNEINNKVVSEARDRSVLVNVVDDAEQSDFIVPSYLQRGDINIAVSTGGKSPALARKLRLRLESEFGDEYGLLASVISDVRSELKRKHIKVDAEAWQQALDIERLIALIKKGEAEKARAVLLDKLKLK
jgi:siroheme synthase-like protein